MSIPNFALEEFMKIAIVGSRTITLNEEDIEAYVSDGDEIVSGGASGVDQCAAEYAKRKGLKLTEFLPLYERYGKAAPILRNKAIVDYADRIIVFWDGNSRGALSVINYAKRTNKPCRVLLWNTEGKPIAWKEKP